MTGVLPWLVRWARRAGTGCVAALVSRYKILFSSPHTSSLYCISPPRPHPPYGRSDKGS
jgi:hypothetical protein